MLKSIRVDIRGEDLREIEKKVFALGNRWAGNEPNESIHDSNPLEAGNVHFLFFDEGGLIGYCSDYDFFISRHVSYDMLPIKEFLSLITDNENSTEEKQDPWIPSREQLVKYFTNLPRLRG